MVLILYKTYGPKLEIVRAEGKNEGKGTSRPLVPDNKFCKTLGKDLSILYKITFDRNSGGLL
jgi:hypothetical protein